MTPRRARGVAVVAVAAVAGAVALLGAAPLPSPPVGHPEELVGWAGRAGPLITLFAAGRLLLLVTGGMWVAMLLTCVVATHLGRAAQLVHFVSSRPWLAGAPLMRLALGLSASSAALVGWGGPAGAQPGPVPPAPVLYNPNPAPLAPVATAVPATAVPATTTPATTTPATTTPATTTPATTTPDTPAPAPDSAVPHLTRPPTAAPPAPGGSLADAGAATAPPTTAPPTPEPPAPESPGPALPVATPSTTPTPSGGTATPAPPVSPATATPPPESVAIADRPAPDVPPSTTWTVRPGDNLWSIAAATLAYRSGRTESDHEVAAYWLAVVAANRPHLPDPDLLFPGDAVSLPPLPLP